MWLSTIILSTFIAAATPSDDNGACRADGDGFCTNKTVYMDLSAANKEVQLKLNTAMGDVLTIWLPKGVEFQERGVETGNEAIFKVEVIGGDEPRVSIRPKAPEGVEGVTGRDMLRERTNLQIATRRGHRINLDLRIWYPSDSVRRLIFKSEALEKEEAYIAGRIKRATKELEGRIDEERARLHEHAKDTAADEVALALLRGFRCSDTRETGMNDGLLWVETERICELGDLIYVVYVIRNRAAKDIFRIKDVELFAEEQKLETAAVFQDATTGKRISMESVALRKGDTARGVVRFNAESAPALVTLRVSEIGGKQRVVDVDGIGF